jgi:hypothetical protein
VARALSELGGTDLSAALARVDERIRLTVAHAAAAKAMASQRVSARAEHEADGNRWDDDGGRQPAAAVRKATKREM